MEGKSHLNPNASPYIPLSLLSQVGVRGESKSTMEKDNEFDVSEDGKSKNAAKAIEHQELDVGSTEYNIRSQGKLPSSDPTSLTDELDDYIFLEEANALDQDLLMESLSCMFPHMSMESLVASLLANNGDLDGTVHMLEQLEYKGDIPEASELLSS